MSMYLILAYEHQQIVGCGDRQTSVWFCMFVYVGCTIQPLVGYRYQDFEYDQEIRQCLVLFVACPTTCGWDQYCCCSITIATMTRGAGRRRKDELTAYGVCM